MPAVAVSSVEHDLDALRGFIRQHCVIMRSATEPLSDSRGRPQAWVFDLRPALLEGWAVRLIARLFWDRMTAAWPFQIAGVEMAALPLLGAIVAMGVDLGYPVSGLAVRRERKTYGRRRAIEGTVAGLPIVLIDDMLNSGRTMVRSAAILAAEGAVVTHIFTVMDFGSPVGADKVRDLGVPATSLFALREFGLGLPAPQRAPTPTPPLTVRWRFEPAERRFGFVARKAAPVVAGDRVLHATEDGWLHAIDTARGAIAWDLQLAKRSAKGVWSTPVVADGYAYIGSYDGTVFKIALADGGVAWRFEGAEWIGSSPAIAPEGAALYIGVEWGNGRGEGGIVRLDTATGRLDWELPIDSQVHGSPLVLADGTVVCGANDGDLRCVSHDGDLRWRVAVGGAVKGGVAAGDGRLFVGAFDGGVVALDAATGAWLWRVPTGGPIFGTPLLHDGLLACTSTDGRVRLLAAADGNDVASFAAGGKLFAGPVLVGGRVVVGAATGRLVQLSWPDLKVCAEHQFAERIVSEVAADDRTLFVPTFDGQLYAVERAGLPR